MKYIRNKTMKYKRIYKTINTKEYIWNLQI